MKLSELPAKRRESDATACSRRQSVAEVQQQLCTGRQAQQAQWKLSLSPALYWPALPKPGSCMVGMAFGILRAERAALTVERRATYLGKSLLQRAGSRLPAAQPQSELLRCAAVCLRAADSCQVHKDELRRLSQAFIARTQLAECDLVQGWQDPARPCSGPCCLQPVHELTDCLGSICNAAQHAACHAQHQGHSMPERCLCLSCQLLQLLRWQCALPRYVSAGCNLLLQHLLEFQGLDQQLASHRPVAEHGLRAAPAALRLLQLPEAVQRPHCGQQQAAGVSGRQEGQGCCGCG